MRAMVEKTVITSSYCLQPNGEFHLIGWCETEFATAETKQITDILMFPIQEIARTGIVW